MLGLGLSLPQVAVNHPSVESGGGGGGDWILADGAWDDAGVWDDAAMWKDAA
jgi:hypothetical protein